jgi:hypothetical protein
MTHGAFLEYLYANNCDVYKEVDTYYKFRKRGTTGSKNMSGLPKRDLAEEMRPFTICQVCHNLGIGVPEEVKDVEEVIVYIRDKHLNNENQNND